MSYFLTKLGAVIGGTVAAGWGIAAGASSISSSSNDSTKKTKTHNTQTTKHPNTVPSKPSCIIWEAKDPGGSKGSREFKELLERHENQDAFFKKWGDNSERKVNTSFKEEIENACQNKSNKKNVNGRVYVWWSTANPSPKWIYASDMHDGRDWENTISQKPSSVQGS